MARRKGSMRSTTSPFWKMRTVPLVSLTATATLLVRRVIAAAVGTSVNIWARAEAGVILKTWAGRTKVRSDKALGRSGLLHANRAARSAAGFSSLRGGINPGQGSVNLGLRGTFGRVWYRTEAPGKPKFILAYGDTNQRPIASLTKMMTGLMTAEAGNFWRPVTVSETAAAVEPNKDGLIIGNRYPRGVLLYSAMLGSNNDAAAALGEDLGGGNYGDSNGSGGERSQEVDPALCQDGYLALEAPESPR
jgi:hypothetical protein